MQLLEYCQGFLLQNMVALLTYDDSVRRLIFGKKLHNHDVLSGLLLTLQARIKARASPRAGRKRVVKENSNENNEMFQRWSFDIACSQNLRFHEKNRFVSFNSLMNFIIRFFYHILEANSSDFLYRCVIESRFIKIIGIMVLVYIRKLWLIYLSPIIY